MEMQREEGVKDSLSFENYRAVVYRNRTYRRFYEDVRIGYETLEQLVDLGRMSPSGMNRQWLRYGIVHTEEGCAKLFPHLRWAASLPDWPGPKEGERPTGYIVVVEDSIHGQGLPVDAGIASQSIMLGAIAKGFGGVMISNMDRAALGELLGLVPGRMHIVLVLALGKVKEQVVVESMPANGATTYWRVGEVHHVPKRDLKDVLLQMPLK